MIFSKEHWEKDMETIYRNKIFSKPDYYKIKFFLLNNTECEGDSYDEILLKYKEKYEKKYFESPYEKDSFVKMDSITKEEIFYTIGLENKTMEALPVNRVDVIVSDPVNSYYMGLVYKVDSVLVFPAKSLILKRFLFLPDVKKLFSQKHYVPWDFESELDYIYFTKLSPQWYAEWY